jgi:arylsulfatase A-like enzyme
MLIAAVIGTISAQGAAWGAPAATAPTAATSGQAIVPAAPATKLSDHKVLLFSIDGLRPDVCLRADSPNIHALMEEGTFTFWAQTTAVSITLPSHTSMLTGVTPARHEIVWNMDLPFSAPVWPKYPTLFELAKRAGYTTSMVAGKSKFNQLAKPNTVDWLSVPQKANSKVHDDDVAAAAIDIIQQHRPDVLFVHFPDVDTAGHAKGWGSHDQLAAVHLADAALGRVVTAWRNAGLAEHGLIVLTTDHGGQGRTHGADDVRSRNTPWIAVGPGLQKDYDLSCSAADDPVRIEDTFATAVDWLQMKVPSGIDGHSQLPWLSGKHLVSQWVEVPESTHAK